MGVKQKSSKVQDQQFQRELYHVPSTTNNNNCSLNQPQQQRLQVSACRGSGRTLRRPPRLSSTSRSTWSSTPPTSTCPWPLTSTVMTKLFLDFPPSSRRALTRSEPTG